MALDRRAQAASPGGGIPEGLRWFTGPPPPVYFLCWLSLRGRGGAPPRPEKKKKEKKFNALSVDGRVLCYGGWTKAGKYYIGFCNSPTYPLTTLPTPLMTSVRFRP